MRRTRMRARRVLACVLALLLVAGLVPALPEAPRALAEEADAIALGDGGVEEEVGVELGEPGLVDDAAEGAAGLGDAGTAEADGDDGTAVVLDEAAEDALLGQLELVAQQELASDGEDATQGEPEADGEPALEVQSASVSNPRVVKDSSMESGQVTTWDCVWFGSYPQTEVAPGDSAYASLQSAAWDANGDATVGGRRYRRISKSDATYSGYWSEDGYGSATWRYFRYDPIKWRVLKVNDGNALVVADQGLDDRIHNSNSYPRVLWSISGMRSWLNGYGASTNDLDMDFSGRSFLDTAFSSDERSAISASTGDRVFLLSNEDVYDASHGFANNFNIYDESRCCMVSDYAHAMGATKWNYSGYEGNCCWWLRSLGSSYCVAFVNSRGFVSTYGGDANYGLSFAVRPALNLNLASSHPQAAGTVSSNGDVDERAPTGDSSASGDVTISHEASIVDKVRAYTSGDLKSQCTTIMESDKGAEARFREIHEFFVGKGFLNALDGIDYLQKTLKQRFAYDTLVCDDIFIAHQYYWWLNETVKGRAARVSLFASDYVFNAKYSGYLDLPALAHGETPNVKKCKDLLYDYMDGMGLEEIKGGYAEFIEDAGKAADKVSGVADKVTSEGKKYADKLIEQLNGAKTQKEAQGILKKAKKLGIGVKKGKTTYTLGETSGFGQFAKAMGKAIPILKCILDTWDDVEDLITLDAHLRCYASYSSFLTEVSQSKDLPLQMRWAAAAILADMDSGPWAKIRDIAFRLVDTALDVGGGIGTASVTSDILKAARTEVFGEGAAATVAGYVAAVQLSAWGINLITDVGSLSKGSDLIEGYEKLCAHYRDKLVASHDAFVADETEDNAWRFFENYNMLWQLRVKAEKAYFKMMDIGGITKYLVQNGTQLKREAVNANLKKLGEMAFVLESDAGLPDTAQFAKYSKDVKFVVDCPVDVDVYDPSGKLVCTMADGRESEVTNSHGTFVVTYRPWTGEWAKAAFVNSGGYRLVARAKDAGTVSVKMMTGEDKQNVWSTDNVAVRKGSKVELAANAKANAATTRVDANGDGRYESKQAAHKAGAKRVGVEGVKLSAKSIKLVAGESASLGVTVSPANASCQDVRWVSTNEKVATVLGGKVVGVGKGSASVLCVSEDNSDAMATCKVSVLPKVVKGKTYSKSGMRYKVTRVAKKGKAGTVTLAKAKNAKKVTVPASVKLADGRSYNVTAVGKGAFKSLSKATSVIVGNKVTTIAAGAFNNLPKLASVTLGTGVKKVGSGAFVKTPRLATVTVKGKLLNKKASVKGMLKGSEVRKTVTVKVPKAMRKTYKKVFTKANLSCPKKVAVK